MSKKSKKMIAKLIKHSLDYFYELEEHSSLEQLKETKKKFRKAKRKLEKYIEKNVEQVKKSNELAIESTKKVKDFIDNS